jgi:hypothetical protein
VQVFGAFIVTTPSAQSASPDHPANRQPGSGVAESVTTVPPEDAVLQLAPHSMPAGALVTVPAPAFWTARVSVPAGGRTPASSRVPA